MSAFCYVAITACGCAEAATVDDPSMAKENAKHVAKWIREGYRVERWSVEDTREKLMRCPHKTPMCVERLLFQVDR